MISSGRASNVKRDLRIAVVTLLLSILIPCGCVYSWVYQTPAFIWSALLGADPREYPHADGPMHVTMGDGDLEQDLLPHFLVTLPCEADGLRYGEQESFVGSEGSLYLRFDTTPVCLAGFLRDNGLSLDPEFDLPYDIPEEYEWDISLTSAQYRGKPSEQVHLTAWVDGGTVYVISQYY